MKRTADERLPSGGRLNRRLRNRYQRPPYYRRHWFLATLMGLGVLAAIAVIAGFILHSRLLEKAGEFDMAQLGKMESASTIFDRRHETFGYIYEQKREPIPLSKMPDDLQHAVIATEDARFYSHRGSDYIGMVRAALKNLRSNKIRQGASTITQQLARNTFPLGGRNFSRKILEVYVSRRIETTLTKERILEYYLNRIYLGSGLYGVEAASKGYFGKPAKEMNLSECATLAGLIKSPNNLSPWRDKAGAKTWRDISLGRMLEQKYISREQYDATVAADLQVKPRVLASSDSYALESIRQQVIAQVGVDRAISAGLKIYTTIDARLQRVAEDSLHKQLDEIERRPAFQNHQTFAQYADTFREEERKAASAAAQDPSAPPANVHASLSAPEYLQGALLVLNNADGSVLAVVGGRNFKHSEYNRALQAQARRPVGTAFTPFVYAAAYQKGISPTKLFLDQVIDNRQVMVGGQTGILGEWGVERVGNHYDGPMPAAIALLRGKNAAAIRVGNEVGLDNVLALARRAGIASPMREFPATFLGSSEITLPELTLGYSSFPNGGWHAGAPRLLTRIEDAEGEVLYEAKAAPRVRTIDEAPAFQVHSALAENLKTGTAAGATARLGLKAMAAGGKPGTAYNSTDVLFAGYNSEVTCSVWMGFDKPSPIYRGAFGNDLAMPVWVEIMNSAATYLPTRDLPMPRTLKKVEVCARSGDLVTDRCFDSVDGERRSTKFTTYVTAAQTPRDDCPVHGGGRSLASLAMVSRVRGGAQPELQANGQPVPRAMAVANTEAVKSIVIKTPSLLGAERDPYGALQPAAAAPAPDAGAPASPAPDTPPEKEVRRALPVTNLGEQEAPVPVKIDPPEELQFN